MSELMELHSGIALTAKSEQTGRKTTAGLMIFEDTES